ncbi:MAG: bifunctional ornithine acetyltransferase/N-acetylglutamate synthase, partial [Armatimonadota bacterium]
MTEERTHQLRRVPGGVTAPAGFLAAGVSCGLKSEGPDVALIVSDREAVAAGLFTTNLVKAAPVLVSQRRIVRGRARAIVANAGNANACTGEQGIRDAEATAAHAASLLGFQPEDVLVASTGVIGHHLDMGKVLAGVTEAVRELSREGSSSAARAIMTTDTRPKELALEFAVGTGAEARTYRVGGIAKGAGMICPNIATMLCFITTDAPASQP